MKQSMEMQSVFKFSDVLFALKSDGPHPGRGISWPRVVLHQGSLTFGQPLGQTDLWSDVPPWYWHLMVKSGTNLGPVDLSSDVPANRGIQWPRVILTWVQLT